MPLTSWTAANAYCVGNGAKLPIIHSADDNDKISQLIPVLSPYWIWIGLKKNSGGQFEWVDGSSMDFDNFNAGQKNYECAYMDNLGKWNSHLCANEGYRYACIVP